MDTGDTAWMLASTALVLFMTPGLALFYGGMVRSKNVLGMLMQNFFSMGLVSVLWAVVAFSLAFGDGGKFIGNFDLAGLKPSLTPTDEREYRTAARRPKFSALSNSKLEGAGIAVMPPLREAVQEYLASREHVTAHRSS